MVNSMVNSMVNLIPWLLIFNLLFRPSTFCHHPLIDQPEM
jgi:hypothetical protein